jgi:hypothetical protein
MTKEAILKKVENKEDLTIDEDYFYYTEIIGKPKEWAERIKKIAIQEQNDEPQSYDDQVFKLVEIYGFSIQGAKKVMAISDNKDPNFLMD